MKMKIKALARLRHIAEDNQGKDSDTRRKEDLQLQIDNKKNTLVSRQNSGASEDSVMKIKDDIRDLQKKLDELKLKKDKGG